MNSLTLQEVFRRKQIFSSCPDGSVVEALLVDVDR
jgi:hypothetical protein